MKIYYREIEKVNRVCYLEIIADLRTGQDLLMCRPRFLINDVLLQVYLVSFYIWALKLWIFMFLKVVLHFTHKHPSTGIPCCRRHIGCTRYTAWDEQASTCASWHTCQCPGSHTHKTAYIQHRIWNILVRLQSRLHMYIFHWTYFRYNLQTRQNHTPKAEFSSILLIDIVVILYVVDRLVSCRLTSTNLQVSHTPTVGSNKHIFVGYYLFLTLILHYL